MDTPDLASPSKRKNPRRRKKQKSQSKSKPRPALEETEEADEPEVQGRVLAFDEQEEEAKQSETLSVSEPEVEEIVNVPQVEPTLEMANQVTIGGVAISTTSVPSTDAASSLVTMPKEARKNLDDDKKHALFQLITKHQHTSFELQAQTIQSLSDLQDSYDLNVCLATLRMHFQRYDLLDVFQIVFPTVDANGNQDGGLQQDATGQAKTVFLLDFYNELTIDQVAQSSIWYARWPDSTVAPWFRENLSLTHQYLSNHMSASLWGKILEDSQPYVDTQAAGGPLVFALLMKRLQVNSQLAVETIQRKLKTLRIDQYQGESVDDMVSHIRAMITRLKSLEKRVDGRVVHSNVPHDINKTLLTLFQTSSDKTFNEVFHAKEVNSYEKAISEGDSAYGTPETILDLATKVYQNRMASEEGWTGQFHKVNETGFSASAENPCFNCGNTGHAVKNCPEPRNPDRIQKNKNTFFEAKKQKNPNKKKGGKAKGDKSRGIQFQHLEKPTTRKKNRAKVKGIWYYYHFKTNAWKKCDKQDDVTNQPFAMLEVPPTPTPTQTQPQVTNEALPAVAQTQPPAIHAQIGAVARAMNDLINQVNQS